MDKSDLEIDFKIVSNRINKTKSVKEMFQEAAGMLLGTHGALNIWKFELVYESGTTTTTLFRTKTNIFDSYIQIASQLSSSELSKQRPVELRIKIVYPHK